MIDFHRNSPAIKYVQHDKNICVFRILESAMYDAREHDEEKAIASWLEPFLKSESLGYLGRIKFANKIMTDRVREKGDQNLRYKMIKCKKN